MTDISNSQHVLQTNGLTAYKIGSCLNAYVCNLFGTVLANGLLQFLEVKISLEGIIALRHKTLLVYQLYHLTAASCNVRLGGGKVKVHNGHGTWFHKSLGKNVLAGTSLVGREQIVCAKHLLHGGLKTVEGLATGISIISNVHGCCLAVRHGIHTRIGEHIKIDILVLQQESIASCLLDGTQTVLNRQKVQFLNYAYLVHFQRYLVLWLIKFN